MPRFVLPLLLCLSLLTGVVSSAWAATRMALLPATVSQASAAADHTASPCHEQAAATVASADPDTAAPCGDNGHCHCVQHAFELAPWQWPAMHAPPSQRTAVAATARATPAPDRLIRPPIA